MRKLASPPSKAGTVLTDRPMSQRDVRTTIRRRAATGRYQNQDRLPHIPRNRDYGLLEKRRTPRSGAADGGARVVRNHGLYDRRGDDASLDEVEQIPI